MLEQTESRMDETKEQNELIVQLFNKMESKIHFLELLNVAKRIYYGDKVQLFEINQLNYYINKNVFTDYSNKIIAKKIISNISLLDDNFYETFHIQKKNGGSRVIHAPKKGLKEFQNALNIILKAIYKPHESANGFVIGKSIVDNARPHINQNYVYNLDLKDFFPNVDKSRIWGRLLTSPFNLNSSNERRKIANMISVMCCVSIKIEQKISKQQAQYINKYVLPQGAPTSPILSNIICEKLDIRLSGVAKRFGLNYSRYADDITFSSKHNTFETKKGIFENIYSKGTMFDLEVRRIITDQNFFINEKKVRLQKQGYRQEVTGLIVNKKINVNRNYINLIRKWIYLWETYGYDKSFDIFIKQYKFGKLILKKDKISMANVIEGKLLYLKMVKGEKDSNYIKLKAKFEKLTKKEEFLDSVLNLWSDEGIEKAMILFYSKSASLINENTN